MRRRAASQRRLAGFCTPMNWNDLLVSLVPGQLQILEQVYVRENGPISLQALQGRMNHLNVHPRTITRWCQRLDVEGLLKIVVSFKVQVCPVVSIERDVYRLVKLWRLRERRARFGLGGDDHEWQSR